MAVRWTACAVPAAANPNAAITAPAAGARKLMRTVRLGMVPSLALRRSFGARYAVRITIPHRPFSARQAAGSLEHLIRRQYHLPGIPALPTGPCRLADMAVALMSPATQVLTTRASPREHWQERPQD